MYGFSATIDRDFILKYLSQEQIMERYAGVKIDFRRRFLSPFRRDRHPTCGFYYSRSKTLYLKDYSGQYDGDCFNVVQTLYSCSFRQALEIIAHDFGLTSEKPRVERVEYNFDYIAASGNYVDIAIERRDWNWIDQTFWSMQGVNRRLLQLFDVHPCQTVWLSGRIVYSYTDNDPAYAYRFGKGEYKIYFPHRTQYRFICNTTAVQGLRQLPPSADFLLLTKSLKDVMVLRGMGMYSVAWQGEAVLPDAETIAELHTRFPLILSLYDFDYTGIKTANRIKRTYGIRPLMLTNGRFESPNYKGKDPAAMVGRWSLPLMRGWAGEFKRRLYARESLKMPVPEFNIPGLTDVPF